ncbi:hypothetical protein BDB01DRAFT_838417 [Pilobolus umbonatus]|nr:hypothetical protein BDB01DRAFT_838417 [Pilobolus umbonatus]
MADANEEISEHTFISIDGSSQGSLGATIDKLTAMTKEATEIYCAALHDGSTQAIINKKFVDVKEFNEKLEVLNKHKVSLENAARRRKTREDDGTGHSFRGKEGRSQNTKETKKFSIKTFTFESLQEVDLPAGDRDILGQTFPLSLHHEHDDWVAKTLTKVTN